MLVFDPLIWYLTRLLRRAGDPSGFEYVHLSVNQLDIGGESFGGDVDGLSFPTVPIDSTRSSLVNLVHGQNDVGRLGEWVLELDALRVLPSVDFGSSSLLCFAVGAAHEASNANTAISEMNRDLFQFLYVIPGRLSYVANVRDLVFQTWYIDLAQLFFDLFLLVLQVPRSRGP